MNYRNRICLALVGALTVPGPLFAQNPDVLFNVPGPADWNVAASWTSPIGPVVPGGPAGAEYPEDVVGISNGGTAFLANAAQFPVDGLVISNGTLEIRQGGSALIQNAPPNTYAGFGTTRVNPNGTLNLIGNGKLDTDNFVLAGGTLKTTFTGAANSPVLADAATLNGRLNADFSSLAPTVGQSFKVVDAAAGALSGAFTSVQATGLARGLVLEPVYDAASGDASVTVDNRLIMTVNRRTGAASFGNVSGPNITIDGYTIASSSGQLSVSGWQSLDDKNSPAGWFEANPGADRISELNPGGELILTAGGASIAIGNPYDWTPTAFAEAPVEDLTFRYFSPDGASTPGLIEYTGPHNNIVLLVDTATGAAAIQNQSTFAAEIDFYTITSASNSLNPAGWVSLDDQNVEAWAEANPKSNRLSELFGAGTGGSLFSPNEAYEIGNAFTVGGQRDLQIRFTLSDGTSIDGIVEYGPFEISQGPLGDTNDDGKVDIVDLNNVRNNFGGQGLGDTNDDSVVDITDLNNVRNNFGAGGSPASVPEPSAWALLGVGLTALGMVRRRRSR